MYIVQREHELYSGCDIIYIYMHTRYITGRPDK